MERTAAHLDMVGPHSCAPDPGVPASCAPSVVPNGVSGAVSSGVSGAVSGVGSGGSFVVPTFDDLAGLAEAELEALIVANDLEMRRREVFAAMAVREFARRGGHLRDGHKSVVAWCRGRLRWSTSHAARVVRVGEALDVLPEVTAVAREARVGVDHLDSLGRVAANPRVHDQLAGSDSLFAGMVHRLFHWQWAAALRRWVELADADGVQQSHAAAHDARRAAVRFVGEEMVFEASGGTLDGAFLREVLDRFADAEWLADRDEARERLGSDRVTAADLRRTAAQRMFDAMVAVFRAACSAPAATATVDPLVNIVVDDDTAARVMRMVAGESVEPMSPLRFEQHRCETVDGVPLSLEAVASAMLIGRLRRVLVAPDGLVIDMGRSRRLFSGAAREAVLVRDMRCLWPGCELRTGLCHTDHTVEWAAGGPTSPWNGGRACSHHNLFKSRHGYTTRRDQHGHWHVTRPDGTEICEPIERAA